MHNDIIIAGFGGQGVVTLGKLVARAAMMQGHEICFWPRYGAEMRGGTANCTVIISSESIDSPLIKSFDILMTLNQPSLIRFEPAVKTNGLVILNQSLIETNPDRSDLRQAHVKATNIAETVGSIRIANIVMLGALAQTSGIFSIETAAEAMKHHFVNIRDDVLAMNQKALKEGAKRVQILEQRAEASTHANRG